MNPTIWVITTGAGGTFLVRLYIIDSNPNLHATPVQFTAENLRSARSQIPKGRTKLPLISATIGIPNTVEGWI
jgi:hypothetical protein